MNRLKHKNILLMKLPYCTHPDVLAEQQDYYTKTPFRPVPSLALASIASFFNANKKADYNLRVVDLNIEGYKSPKESIDIKQYSFLLEQHIKDSSYDVLGLSVMFIFNVRWVKDAIRLSRKYHKDAKIILGGAYPTLFPERSLSDHDIDAIVIGEGEATFLHLMNKFNNFYDENFEKKYPFGGYGLKDSDGKNIITSQQSCLLALEGFPSPDWDQLNVKKYFERSGDNTIPIEASRGCPYSCTYCTTHLSWGKRLRYKTTDGFLQEIKSLKEKYHNPHIFIVDDNITFSREWIIEFLSKLVDADLSLEITSPNTSVKHMDEEIIDLWVKAGCKSFSIAVETGSKEMQKRIKKNIDFDKLREVVGILKQKGIPFNILWMVGFPNETSAQIQETFDLVRELRAFLNQFSIVIPYPGTEMHDELKENDLLLFDEKNLENYDRRKAECIKTTEWTYAQLRKMIYDINIEMNFLNNPFIETPSLREHLLSYLENLLKRLPDHVIAHIVTGYICKLQSDMDRYHAYYSNAQELLRDKILADTFNKYLAWDHYIIKDFKRFCALGESLQKK